MFRTPWLVSPNLTSNIQAVDALDGIGSNFHDVHVSLVDVWERGRENAEAAHNDWEFDLHFGLWDEFEWKHWCVEARPSELAAH